MNEIGMGYIVLHDKFGIILQIGSKKMIIEPTSVGDNQGRVACSVTEITDDEIEPSIKGFISQLKSLKPVCFFTGDSYVGNEFMVKRFMQYTAIYRKSELTENNKERMRKMSHKARFYTKVLEKMIKSLSKTKT